MNSALSALMLVPALREKRIVQVLVLAAKCRFISKLLQVLSKPRSQRNAETPLPSVQDRLRQNINSLNQVSGQQQQVQSYAKQLADQENKLAALRDRAAELHRKRAALEAELNSTIEKMEF